MAEIIGTVEKLLEKLKVGEKATRENAVVSLQEKPAEIVLPGIAGLLADEPAPEVHACCLDIADSFGAMISLVDIRKDGWLERIGQAAENFQIVSQIIGVRHLAYSILLGIKISSLARDPISPDNTVVHFTVGDDVEQVLPLGQFRSQVAAAMLAAPSREREISLPLEPEDVPGVIGDLQMLVAPLFGITLETLVAFPTKAGAFGVVECVDESGSSFATLMEFKERIRESLKGDINATVPQRFHIDLSIVDAAEQAFEEGNNDKVISLLETWPGLLSTMLKTPEAGRLKSTQLGQIARGLKTLGDAYLKKGDIGWSQELYRLGIQYVRDMDMAGPLFLALGQLMNKEERYGEAIGYLRRAMSLEVEPKLVYPALGRSMLNTNKTVGAFLILREAASILEQTTDQFESDAKAARETIEEAKLQWPKW